MGKYFMFYTLAIELVNSNSAVLIECCNSQVYKMPDTRYHCTVDSTYTS